MAMDHRFLRPMERIAYIIYDSFTRANADALGDTEPKGPRGLASLIATWQTIGGDLDIVSNAVQGGAAQSELFTNPGFETFTGTEDDGVTDDFSTWVEVGIGSGDLVEAITTSVHGGTYAAKLTYGNNGCFVRQDASVTAAKLYLLSFWTRGDGTVAGRYNLYDQTNGAWLIGDATPISTGITGTSYAQVLNALTAPTGCALFRLALQSSDAAGVVYYDDASIQECHAEYVDAAVADVEMIANITMPAGGAAPFGLIIRRSGSTCWIIYVQPGTTGTDFKLIEINNGVPTERDTADIDWSPSTAYEITVQCAGQDIVVLVNDVEQLAYASASVGETNTQFGLWDSGEGNAVFSDVAMRPFP